MPEEKFPFLISVPHGGTEVPESVRTRLAMTREDLRYYCDPETRDLFGFQDRVAAYIDTPISRMIVDLNRPPLPLPLRDPDGIIKTRTIDGRDVFRKGMEPDIGLARRLLVDHYFPYHQRIDEMIDRHGVKIAFDCHSMLPTGSLHQKDAGRTRPLICLGNNGDLAGKAKRGGITTCTEEIINRLAVEFRRDFPDNGSVAINSPFSGGFIANAHFWHKDVPWIQIEINRSLYESMEFSKKPSDGVADSRVAALKERIWAILVRFWEQAGD